MSTRQTMKCIVAVCLLFAGTALATVYDISSVQTITFDSANDTLSNTNSLTAWTDSTLNLRDGSDLSNVDFTSLGITSWTTARFGDIASTTWDGANLSGITFTTTQVNFGYNDSMVGLVFTNGTFNHSGKNQPFLFVDAEGANFSGTTFNITTTLFGAFRKKDDNDTRSTIRDADFSKITWGAAMSNAAEDFFNVGPGTTSAADKDHAVTFEGADLSLITGTAKSIMIANLGKKDGAIPIGAKYDLDMLLSSGWSAAELDAAGWQKQFPGNNDLYVYTTKSAMAPSFSTNDLAQMQYLSSSATGGNQVETLHSNLFSGVIGTTSSDTGSEAATTMDRDNTFTVTFDTSVNAAGYDITGIDSIFGWTHNGINGRSNQGYEIILTFVDDSTATLAGPTHWEPNSPAYFWTKVLFVSGDGGVLHSGTIVTNGISAAGSGVTATGVKAVTFDISHNATASGVVVGREVDIFGVPTPTPPKGTVIAIH